MSGNKERRFLSPEFRAEENDGKRTISGYAAVFNTLSDDLGWFREKILPGAFKDAVENTDTVALFNHDSNLVLGRKSSGTLRLYEDNHGLHMEVELPNTSYANDLWESIGRGDVKQQSFGFTVDIDEWHTEEGRDVRTIEKVKDLFDVSPVTYPAYPDTSVARRSLDELKSVAINSNNDAIVIENEDIEMELLLNKHEEV